MAHFSQRPSVDEFSDAVKKLGGNLTKVAEYFGVSRTSIHKWRHDDPEFEQCIIDSRKRMFDRCIEIGYALALGIPELDEDNKIIGWKERPDSNMVRYLLGTLGRDEGFGDKTDLNIDSSSPISINITTATGDPITP